MKSRFLLINLIVVLILFSCNKDEKFEPVNANFSGLVQKGPFLSGSIIYVQELNDNLIPNGNTHTTSTADDFGSFNLTSTIASPLVEVVAQGFYFNEVDGSISDSKIYLSAIVKTSEAITANINILTTLSSIRIIYLVNVEGKSFDEAEKQAENEVLKIFGITEENVSKFNEMDMSKEGKSNAILIAVSAIMQNCRYASETATLISNIRNDIRKDGTLDYEYLVNVIKQQCSELQLPDIRTNLEQRYESLGLDIEVAEFENYVYGLLSFDITSDLLLYLPFNGNANDESGHGNDATTFEVTLTEDRFGNSDKAYHFNGNGSYIEIPGFISLSNTSWSYSLWFNLEQFPSIVDDAWFLSYKGVIPYDDIYIYVDNDDNAVKTYLDAKRKISTEYVVSTNTWYQIAITYDQYKISLYVDGALKTAANGNFTTSLNTNYVISNVSSASSGGIMGKVDDVRLYNRTLNSPEIRAIYEMEKASNLLKSKSNKSVNKNGDVNTSSGW